MAKLAILLSAILAVGFATRATAAEPRTDLRPDHADVEKSELSFEDEVHGVRASGKDFEVTFDSHQMIVHASKEQAALARKLKASGKAASVTVSLVTSRIVRITAKE